MRAKILLIVLSALIIGGIFFLRALTKTKPDITSQQTEVMKRILAECSPLGSPTDPKVKECELRIRAQQQ